MAGVNVTGLPDPSDYHLGRGIGYLGLLDEDTYLLDDTSTAGGLRDLGNMPEFTLNVTEEELKHYSSRGGKKVTDRSVTISIDISGSFKLDELNNENLALHTNGTQTTFVNPAVVGVTTVVLTQAVKFGRWYELKTAAGVRLYNVGAVTTFRDPSGTPAAINAADFTVNAVEGLIRFTTAPVTASFVEGDDVSFTTAANSVAGTPQRILALEATERRYRLVFISKNINDNEKRVVYTFPQVALKSQGDQTLIGDNFSDLSFTFTAEKDVNGNTLIIDVPE